MVPASTTYKFQMIDVVVGNIFKDGICNEWATWMLNECEKMGTTSAGNYKHPTYPDCLQWVSKVWRELDTAGVVKASQRLGMTADPGPEVEGYVDKYFKDYQPGGEEIPVEYLDFAADLEE